MKYSQIDFKVGSTKQSVQVFTDDRMQLLQLDLHAPEIEIIVDALWKCKNKINVKSFDFDCLERVLVCAVPICMCVDGLKPIEIDFNDRKHSNLFFIKNPSKIIIEFIRFIFHVSIIELSDKRNISKSSFEEWKTHTFFYYFDKQSRQNQNEQRNIKLMKNTISCVTSETIKCKLSERQLQLK